MARWIGAIFALLVTAGCASGPSVDWRAEATALTYPDGYRRLFLRTVTVEDLAPVSTAAPGERLSLDPSVAREVVETAVRGLAMFDSVGSVGSGALPETDGLVLDLDLENAALSHVAAGDDATLALVLWFCTGLPGLSVHDQLYAFHCEPRARILDARTGAVVVPWEALGEPTTARRALNFHERSSGPLAYLETCCMPPPMIACDEAAVLRRVLPEALRPAMHELARRFAAVEFAPAESIGFFQEDSESVHVEAVHAVASAAAVTSALDVTLVAAVSSSAHLRELRIDGEPRLVVNGASLDAPTVELPLGELSISEDQPVNVSAILGESEEAVPLVTLVATPTGDLRPRRSR